MKNRNLIESFNNALNGIAFAIRGERNMKIHVTAAVLVLLLSLYYRISRVEFLIVCIAIGLVLISELFNTAVEVLVNIIVDVYHPKAKVVKDMAAGAVMLSALISVLIGYFVFFDRLRSDVEVGISWLGNSPVHITVIALFITLALVLAMKIFFRSGTPFKGGMPSGHSAAAASITTAVAILSRDASITLLSIAVALLVIQSRLEAKIHTLIEVAAGGVLGFLVTLLLFQIFYL